MTITGANLRIVNGLGATDTTNDLGNLIVGYNEPRQANITCDPSLVNCAETRTGSHNIVVGSEQNFSSFGGLVVGLQNEISGAFASVSAGLSNTASGDFSSISGGDNNKATGQQSWVGGGDVNAASGFLSSVCGGLANTASGAFPSVCGGREHGQRRRILGERWTQQNCTRPVQLGCLLVLKSVRYRGGIDEIPPKSKGRECETLLFPFPLLFFPAPLWPSFSLLFFSSESGKNSRRNQ